MTADYYQAKTSSEVHSAYLHYQQTNIHRVTGVATPQPIMKVTRSWTDSVTKGPDLPGWRYLIARGQNATTRLFGRKTLARWFDAYMYSRIKPSSGMHNLLCTGFNVNGFNSSLPSGIVDATSEAKAASNFLNDYLDKLSTWRGGNAIAEFRETVRALNRPVGVLYRQSWDFVGRVGRLKKVYRLNPNQYGKQLTDAWLGYQLAIKPTVADVDDAWQSVIALSTSLGCYDELPIVGSSVRESLVSQQIGLTAPGFSQTEYDRIVKLTNSVIYRGVLRCEPLGSNSAIAANFGVGFDDILPAVWEAVPFSFVVDYFTNVGECLDAIRYLRNSPRKMRRTFRNVLDTLCSDFRASPDSAHIDASTHGGRFYTRSTYVDRTVISEVPYPGLQFKMPNAGSTKWLNVAALAAGWIRTSPYGKLAHAVGV